MRRRATTNNRVTICATKDHMLPLEYIDKDAIITLITGIHKSRFTLIDNTRPGDLK